MLAAIPFVKVTINPERSSNETVLLRFAIGFVSVCLISLNAATDAQAQQTVLQHRSPPPVADGTTRLYPISDVPKNGLSLFPFAGEVPISDCTGLDFTRILEGKLQGTNYTFNLTMSSREPSQGAKAILKTAKVRASVLKTQLGTRLPPFHQDKLRTWVKENIRPDAPPEPDSAGDGKWRSWAFVNAKQGSRVPDLYQLDEEARNLGLASRGEVLLATTEFDIGPQESTQTATVEGADVAPSAGDKIILRIRAQSGVVCIRMDQAGKSFIDIPATGFSETAIDESNKVYWISGTLVTPKGKPLARTKLLFSPRNAAGSAVTVYDRPNQFGVMQAVNPRCTTNGNGKFNLRVRGKILQKSAVYMEGIIQVVSESPPGRLRIVGNDIVVKFPNKDQLRLDLGRVISRPGS
jgi:hypothetical protein